MVRFIIPKLYQIIRFVLCGASGVCCVSLCRTIYYRCSLPMLLYTFRSPPHRLRFFVWKQPFRSGPYCGDTCWPPPPWGRRRTRISVAGAGLRFAEPSQSGRRLCCKASCPNASLHSYPDDVSRRRFDALCDAGRQAPLRGGVPLAEVRTVPPPMDAVVFGASVKIY